MASPSIPLARMARQARPARRKREIVFRPVRIPSTYASDLYVAAYAPVLRIWNEALPGIMAQYGRSLAMTADSPEDLGARLDAAENAANSVILRLRIALSAWVERAERWQRGRWRQTVLTATGVDIGTMIGPADVRATLGAAIERNVGLVKSISDQLRQRIAQAVFDGLRNRSPARDVAKAIAEAGEMGQRRARNVAADQLVKISSELAAERRRQAVGDTWEWVHSAKKHPREEHRARDGKRYTDSTAPADTPGSLPYCGCTERAVLSLDGEF